MERMFEQFTVSILKLNKLVQKIKTYEMRESGLKAVHVMCVYFLGGSENGLSASELVKLTLEDKAAVSRALALLKQKGYLEYCENSRNSAVRLTEEGKRLARFVGEETAAAESACSLDFSEEERLSFYKSLEKIAENMQIYYQNLLEKDVKND